MSANVLWFISYSTRSSSDIYPLIFFPPRYHRGKKKRKKLTVYWIRPADLSQKSIMKKVAFSKLSTRNDKEALSKSEITSASAATAAMLQRCLFSLLSLALGDSQHPKLIKRCGKEIAPTINADKLNSIMFVGFAEHKLLQRATPETCGNSNANNH